MNKISNFKNRFRILKGGKVSLVVSAMLLSSTVFVSSANAAPGCDEDANPLTCERTTQKKILDGSDYTIESTGSIVPELINLLSPVTEIFPLKVPLLFTSTRPAKLKECALLL